MAQHLSSMPTKLFLLNHKLVFCRRYPASSGKCRLTLLSRNTQQEKKKKKKEEEEAIQNIEARSQTKSGSRESKKIMWWHVFNYFNTTLKVN